MRLFTLIGLAALAFALTPGCSRNPEKALASPGVRSTPNLLDEIAAKPAGKWKAWRLRAFQMDHIWAGAGAMPADPKTGNYRAKMTVWNFDALEHDLPLAEIYFRDPAQLDPGLHRNPDPNDAQDPANRNIQGTGPGLTFRLHFPIQTLGPIMSTLRNANEKVYLFYYENQWAIGVNVAESVGID